MTGSFRIVENLLPFFAESAWQIHIFANVIDKKQVTAMGAIPHVIPVPGLGKTAKRFIFDWLARARLRRAGFDVTWGHGDTLDQDVLTLHNCYHAVHEAIFSAVAPDAGSARLQRVMFERGRFRRIIVNSHLMQQDLSARYQIPRESFVVIRPGTDPEHFSAEQRESRRQRVRQQLQISEETFLVGLITSGDFRKRGVDRFFRVLRQMSPDIRSKTGALVVGKDSSMLHYRKLAQEASLGQGAFFMDTVPNVADYYCCLDVMLYPAYFEEYGITVAEAMMCGTPVVTHSAVGASEIIEGAAAELVSRHFDVELMAAMLMRVLNDKQFRRAAVSAGRRCSGRYDWKGYFERTVRCFEWDRFAMRRDYPPSCDK